MDANNKRILRKTGLATAAVLFLILLIYSANDSGAPSPYTVYSKTRNGLMAARDTCKQAGFDTQLLLDPISADLPDGMLLVLSPLAPPSAAELAALEQWIKRGNTLVCSPYGSIPIQAMSQALGQQTEPGSGKKAKSVLNSVLTGSAPNLRVRTMSAEIQETFSLDELSGSMGEGVGNRFGQQTPKKRPMLDQSVQVVPLYAVDKRPVVGIAGLGSGRVIVLSDPQCFTNILIGKDDNIIFLNNIIASGGQKNGTRVIFYEYGNGYERFLPGAGLMRLWDSYVKTGLLIFLIGFLLMVLLEAQRFGPVRQPFTQGRFRSEYLGAISDLLSKGNGTDIVLEELGKKFLSDSARALGLPGNASADQISELAQSKGHPEHAELVRLLKLAEENHEPVNEEVALDTVQKWYKIRKELSKLR